MNSAYIQNVLLSKTERDRDCVFSTIFLILNYDFWQISNLYLTNKFRILLTEMQKWGEFIQVTLQNPRNLELLTLNHVVKEKPPA